MTLHRDLWAGFTLGVTSRQASRLHRAAPGAGGSRPPARAAEVISLLGNLSPAEGG